MVTMSTAIMAHVSRRNRVRELLKRLDCDPTVVYDTAAPSRDPAQRWATGKRAWEAATGNWHLVLQDDAVVCDDFVARAVRALETVPNRNSVVTFYLGMGRRAHDVTVRHALALADRDRSGWARLRFCYWGVAIALPSRIVPGMLADGTNPKRNYDTRIGRHVRDRLGWDCLAPVPSLVDHDDGGVSLVGHDAPGRRAARFAGTAPKTADSSQPAEGQL